MCNYIHGDRMHKAKDKKTGQWVTGWYCEMGRKHDPDAEAVACMGNTFYKDGVGTYQSFLVDPGTLCRCTGIEDGAGNMIWERDIVERLDRSEDDPAISKTGIVKYGRFNESTPGFYIRWSDPWLRSDIGYWAERVKVVGNTVDHPACKNKQEK